MNRSRKISRKCMVPSCSNSTYNSRHKLFVNVKETVRKRWCEELGLKYIPGRAMFCCEDHLNLEEDLQNYQYWKLVNGAPILKSNAKLRINQCPSQTSPLSVENIQEKFPELREILQQPHPKQVTTCVPENTMSNQKKPTTEIIQPSNPKEVTTYVPKNKMRNQKKPTTRMREFLLQRHKKRETTCVPENKMRNQKKPTVSFTSTHMVDAATQVQIEMKTKSTNTEIVVKCEEDIVECEEEIVECEGDIVVKCEEDMAECDERIVKCEEIVECEEDIVVKCEEDMVECDEGIVKCEEEIEVKCEDCFDSSPTYFN